MGCRILNIGRERENIRAEARGSGYELSPPDKANSQLKRPGTQAGENRGTRRSPRYGCGRGAPGSNARPCAWVVCLPPAPRARHVDRTWSLLSRISLFSLPLACASTGPKTHVLTTRSSPSATASPMVPMVRVRASPTGSSRRYRAAHRSSGQAEAEAKEGDTSRAKHRSQFLYRSTHMVAYFPVGTHRKAQRVSSERRLRPLLQIRRHIRMASHRVDGRHEALAFGCLQRRRH